MKPKYGARSSRVLSTIHEDLVTVFEVVLDLGFDHSLIEGHRSEEDQNYYFDSGKSKVKFPDSKHNSFPSMAVDAMPWFKEHPNIDWNHKPSMYHFAGVIKGVAAMLYKAGEITHLIRWGGDWDNDFDVREKQWDDSPHYELYKPKKETA